MLVFREKRIENGKTTEKQGLTLVTPKAENKYKSRSSRRINPWKRCSINFSIAEDVTKAKHDGTKESDVVLDSTLSSTCVSLRGEGSFLESRTVPSSGNSLPDNNVNRKSCMKVKTLEDSLRSENAISNRQKIEGALRDGSDDQSRNVVSFGCVKVLEYERILGDNPAVTKGIPISLGWKLMSQTEYTVDSYSTVTEKHEGGDTMDDRKPMQKLKLSPEERKQIIKDAGFSKSEIAKSMRQIVRIRENRHRTIAGLGTLDKVEELLETIRRRVKRCIL